MKTFLAASLGILLAMAGADAAFAKAKKPGLIGNGCSAGDLTGAGTQACIDKGNLDILNSRSYIHQVVCTASGKYCCKVDQGTSAISGCTTISGRPAVNGRPPSGAVQPGGAQAN